MLTQNDMMVYSRKDILVIANLMNTIPFSGLETARKISTIGTLLESGKPLEDYLEKGSDGDGDIEQDEQGSQGTD